MKENGGLRLDERPASWARSAVPATGLETLATAPASRQGRIFAVLVCLVAITLTAALLPSAGAAMPPIPAYLPLYQATLVLTYALTTWLLLAQYTRTRSVALLVLAAGGLCTTLAVGLQLVCFPNVIAPGLLVGRGAVTLTWLWNVWHVCPPAFTLAYAFVEHRDRPVLTAANRVNTTAAAAVAGSVLVMAGVGYVTCVHPALLPQVSDADGGYRALTTSGIGPALVALTAVALGLLCWATRLRSVLQLWLAVSLVLLLLDNIITDLGAARETVGWFTGRIGALLAALVVLAVYLREVDHLYRRAELEAGSHARARAEAQAVRENLEIALEASGMGDWELDLATDTSRRTLRHDRLFGYTELQPRWGRAQFMEHVCPEDRRAVLTAFRTAMETGRLELECRIHRAGDGAVRWLSVLGRTAFDDVGKPVAMAGCVLDVTERRLTEERLRQAERMEAVGQLTGGVAHDFNNLLTIMLGNLDLIARRSNDPARVERLANAALTAGKRGTELTDKLLSFSRRQIVQPETVNLNRLLATFHILLQRAVGEAVELVMDLDPGLDPARLDQSQFQAALLNLAGNARDAMPGGGQLRIETRNIAVGAGGLPGLPDVAPGDYLRIAVRDTGVGMDKATAARAFEPFFTTKEVGKGTGLGLSQVYGFVRQAGGHCRIETAPGLGCAIEMVLPRVAGALGQGNAPEDVVPLRRATGGEVVLVVEDEDAVREMAAESLEGLGYTVLTAPDARVALDVLRGPTRVDVLFSDVVMPGGMNGAQLATEATAIRTGLKVLLTSGYMTTATGGARNLPEGVPLLRKPYLREDLAAKLQMVIGA